MNNNGFIPNSFQVPNELIDRLMPDISGTAFMCLLFIIRKTKGWQKEADYIAVSQFQKSIGKGRATVFRALDELSEKGLIVVKKEDGKINEYALNPDIFTRLKNDTPNAEPVSKMRLDPSQKCDPTRLKNETLQNTLNTKYTFTKASRVATAQESYIPFDLSASEYLLNQIRARLPNFKEPKLPQWANHVRLMREQDRREQSEILAVIEWCQRDSFWQSNILSTKKLREKFDQLNAKRLSQNNGGYQNAGISKLDRQKTALQRYVAGG